MPFGFYPYYYGPFGGYGYGYGYPGYGYGYGLGSALRHARRRRSVARTRPGPASLVFDGLASYAMAATHHVPMPAQVPSSATAS